jgi:hypothetical protein
MKKFTFTYHEIEISATAPTKGEFFEIIEQQLLDAMWDFGAISEADDEEEV